VKVFDMKFPTSLWLGLVGVATSLPILAWSSSSWAAERVVLKYKIFRESVSVPELSTFARTGEMSPAIAAYMRMSNQNPENVRKTLNDEAKVSPILLDRGLNNPVGNVLLDQVGQVIQTPSGGANREALRASLVLSASKDSRISLIEVIENYPTQEVHVEGDRLAQAFQQLSRLERSLGNLLGDFKLFR
jgi:hypothetical protein